jgi:hypothetical protein
MISKGAVLSAVQRSRALGDRTPITQDDLWRRVEKDASDKPYKALAIDLIGKGRRQRDQAIVEGLKSHKRLDDAERSSPAFRERIRTVFEDGLARAAFSEQRAALGALLEEGFDRLREAGELIADHLRSLRGLTWAEAQAAGRSTETDDGPAPPPSSPSPG